MTETPSNIDDFNRGAALVLERLYQAFPREVYVKVEELDPGAADQRLTTYAATMDFLLREGFIHGRKIADGRAPYRAVLTSKGLAVLNSVPDALKERTTLGTRIGAALKTGTKEAVNSAISQVISVAAAIYLPR